MTTDFDMLSEARLDDRTSFDFELNVKGDTDTADMAVVLNWGRCKVVLIPTIGDDLLHVELHQFVDEMTSGPSGAVTIRPQS